MGLADYLAKNYLSADKPSKKRKRKHAANESGLIIADDGDDHTISRTRPDEDDDDFGPTIVASDRNISNRKTNTTTTWKTIGTAAPSNAEQAAADAIIASAQAEQRSRAQAAEGGDDAPAIVGTDGMEADYDGPTMASGAMAGLQTAAQVTAALKRRETEEKAAMLEAGLDAGGAAQETVYRDASGRRIDVAMKRAEMRRKAEEEERRKGEEADRGRGDVQMREREERRERLEEARGLGVARYADDEELNREMKDKERWNDPMAQLLVDAGVRSGGGKARRKKVYEGASEPNRYGIKPGYRWDGVDRSTGFERKWFAARNKQENRKNQEYAWEMDE